MRTRRTGQHFFWLVPALATIVLSTCGTDHDDSSSVAPVSHEATSAAVDDVGAYVDAIMRRFDSSAQGFDETQGSCVAGATLDAIGIEALRSAGVTPENIPGFGDPTLPLLGSYVPTQAQDQEIASRLSECMNLVDVAIGWYPGFPAIAGDTKACVENELRDDPTFELGMVLLIVGTGTDVSNGFVPIFLGTAMQTCGIEISPPPTG